MVGRDKYGAAGAGVGGGNARILDQIGAAIPFLLDQQHGVGTDVEAGGDFDMTAVTVEIAAPDRIAGKCPVETAGGLAALERAFEAVEILVDNEIDDAGHGIGAPG